MKWSLISFLFPFLSSTYPLSHYTTFWSQAATEIRAPDPWCVQFLRWLGNQVTACSKAQRVLCFMLITFLCEISRASLVNTVLNFISAFHIFEIFLIEWYLFRSPWDFFYLEHILFLFLLTEPWFLLGTLEIVPWSEHGLQISVFKS